MDRQNNNFDIREQLTQFLCCFNPVLDWHVDVHQDDVWFLLIAEFEHLNPIATFPDDLNVVLHIQNAFKPFTEQLMIISQKNFN
ncbi:hypothetical protein D3C73_1293410 [compost metagenome]